MKKNHLQDQQAAAELLKKLQASYLGSVKDTSSGKKKTEKADEEELHEKLKSVLNSVSETPEAAPAPDDSPLAKEAEPEDAPLPAAEPAEEPVSKEPATPIREASVPQKQKKNKKESRQKQEKPKAPAETVRKNIPIPSMEPEKPVSTPEDTENARKETPAAHPLDLIIPRAEESAGVPLTSVPLPETAPEPEPIKAEPVKPEPIKPEPVKPEPVKPEPVKPEPVKPEPVKAEPVKPEPIKAEQPNVPAIQKPEKERSAERANVTIPISPRNVPDFRKRETEEPSIVIRPASAAPASEVIVIKPKTQEPVREAPRPVENPSAEPIRIAPKTSAPAQPEGKAAPAPAPEKKPKPSSASRFSPTTLPTKRPNSPEPPLKTQEKPPKEAAPARQPNPHAGKKNSARRGSVPSPAVSAEDEKLDEVLDEIREGDALELPAEPVAEVPVEEPKAPAKKSTIFQRRKQKKQEQDKQKLPLNELLQKRFGLNEDDISMLLELGYDNELGTLIGFENVRRLRTDYLRKSAEQSEPVPDTAFGYRGAEYTGGQKAGVIGAYVRDRRGVLWRMIVSALLSLILLFTDYSGYFPLGETVKEFLSGIPLLLPVGGLLILILTTLLSLRRVITGTKDLLHFQPSPYSAPAILIPFTLLYDLYGILSGEALLPMNFLVSLSLLLICVCDAFRLADQLRTFRILSSDAEKTILESTIPRKKKLRQGDRIVKILNDDVGESFYRVRRAEQVTGFFRRVNYTESAFIPFSVALILSLSLATATAISAAVHFDSFPQAVVAFMTVLAVSTPASSIFTYFYPLYRANSLLRPKGSAIIGEESVAEFDQPKTVIFRDSEFIDAKKHTEIFVREGDDFRRDMLLAGCLFRKIGGTLAHVGMKTAHKNEPDPPVTLVRITDTGTEAIIDNRFHVLAGSAAFLARAGIRVPKESSDKALRREKNVSVLYLAIDGALKLSFEMEYRANTAFERMVSRLADMDTAVAIHTYDPSLNDAFLQRCRGEDSDPVRVIKPGRYEENLPVGIADAGIVSLGDSLSVVPPLCAVKRVRSVQRFGQRMQLISTLLGTAAVFLLTLLGHAEQISMLPILCYQGVWLIVSWISGRTELNRDTLFLDQ